MTRAPRSAARATSRPPVTPLAPLTRSCSPACRPSASPRTCAAVSAGTGNAAAAAELRRAVCGRAVRPGRSAGAPRPPGPAAAPVRHHRITGAHPRTASPAAALYPPPPRPAPWAVRPPHPSRRQTNSSQLPHPRSDHLKQHLVTGQRPRPAHIDELHRAPNVQSPLPASPASTSRILCVHSAAGPECGHSQGECPSGRRALQQERARQPVGDMGSALPRPWWPTPSRLLVPRSTRRATQATNALNA